MAGSGIADRGSGIEDRGSRNLWTRMCAVSRRFAATGGVLPVVLIVAPITAAAIARPLVSAILDPRSAPARSAIPDPRSPILDPRSAPAVVQERGNTDYNGKFVWVRLKYEAYRGGFGRGRGGWDECNGPIGWAHDYPCAEQNITRVLAEVTKVLPGVIGGNVYGFGDPELHKYPIAYLSEPGDWQLTDEEAKSFGAYLLKGGFLIVDDFPTNAWPNFEAQMRRALPQLEPIQLDSSHAVFHTFFEIPSLSNLYGGESGFGGGRRSPPLFVGYFIDNDPTKRMLAVANYMNDLGENWERAERGFSFIGDGQTEESYKFGINYIVWGLIH
jgi:hypothetical protein